MHDAFKHFAKAGPQHFALVTDFDHTLTKFGSTITHQAFDPNMPVERNDPNKKTLSLQAWQDNLNKKFIAQVEAAADRKTQYNTMADWWGHSHKILCMCDITERTIRQAPQYLSWRDGAKELLEACWKRKIPIFIVSAGIENIIEEGIIQLVGYMPENVVILANRMEFNEEGVLEKFNNNLVHSHNKSGFFHMRCRDFFAGDRKNVLVLGDSEPDAVVLGRDFQGKKVTICVNPRDEFQHPDFDLYHQEESLEEVVELIETMFPLND